MQADTHEIVHEVVAGSHAAEHVANQFALILFAHLLVPWWTTRDFRIYISGNNGHEQCVPKLVAWEWRKAAAAAAVGMLGAWTWEGRSRRRWRLQDASLLAACIAISDPVSVDRVELKTPPIDRICRGCRPAPAPGPAHAGGSHTVGYRPLGFGTGEAEAMCGRPDGGRRAMRVSDRDRLEEKIGPLGPCCGVG